MRGGRGEGGERRGAAAAAERCNAKRVLLGGEGAEVHLLGCTPSTSLCTPSSLYTPSSLCTPSGKEQLRRPRTSSTHQKQMPLSSLQKVHLFKVPTLLPEHTLREVHRSNELHPLRVHTSERCCQHKPIMHIPAQQKTNHAHVLHSCAVTCRLLRSVHRKLGWLLVLKSYKPW